MNMNSKRIFAIKTIVLSVIVVFVTACEGRREFPELEENGVLIDNTDILLVSGETAEISPRYEPNINPTREYAWEIDDPSVADIQMNEDFSVTITAQQAGETTLRIVSQDSDNLTAEAKLKVISSEPIDVTDEGTLTVSQENGGGPGAGEGSPKLVDGDENSKYLSEYKLPFWMTLQFDEAKTINVYTLTSGNDAPGRDPRDWQLLGSNDGENWELLDERNGQDFNGRNLTREFYFSNDTAYTYYRLDVTSNNGGGLFQMSEWRVFIFPQ